ncbi:hypothetical protein ACVMIH_007805 [Bradyrhizobium sp. USDA 4503]
MTDAKIWSADLVHLKWLRVFVVEFDEDADAGLELPDGGMNASLDLLSGKFGKLNLVDPGRRSRREVDMIVRPASEPRFNLRCLVGGVVVHDDMDIEPFRDLNTDLFEKLQELVRSVELVAFANYEPQGDIACSKQRGRTMPHVAVRTTFGVAARARFRPTTQRQVLRIKGVMALRQTKQSRNFAFVSGHSTIALSSADRSGGSLSLFFLVRRGAPDCSGSTS